MRSCPKHGTKYIEKSQDGHYICMAPIPKDKYGLRNCFYECKEKRGPKKIEICNQCGLNPPEYGKICGECRKKNQREAYHQKKKIPFAKR